MLRLSTRSHGICGTARTPTNAFAARSGAEVSREELAHRAKPTVSRFPRCETYGFALPFLTSQLPVRLEQRHGGRQDFFGFQAATCKYFWIAMSM